MSQLVIHTDDEQLKKIRESEKPDTVTKQDTNSPPKKLTIIEVSPSSSKATTDNRRNQLIQREIADQSPSGFLMMITPMLIPVDDRLRSFAEVEAKYIETHPQWEKILGFKILGDAPAYTHGTRNAAFRPTIRTYNLNELVDGGKMKKNAKSNFCSVCPDFKPTLWLKFEDHAERFHNPRVFLCTHVEEHETLWISRTEFAMKRHCVKHGNRTKHIEVSVSQLMASGLPVRYASAHDVDEDEVE